jgi:glycine cleavage system H protein
MTTDRTQLVFYQRARFTTSLPPDCLYSASHCWLARQGDDLWRIGFTKFAVRMLGETVDRGFEIPPDAAVKPGQIIGWIEGFKAMSDIYCVADGRFAGGNPALQDQIQLVNKDPFGRGWIYGVRGAPDAQCVDVDGYRQLLDRTIDTLMARQKTEDPA